MKFIASHLLKTIAIKDRQQSANLGGKDFKSTETSAVLQLPDIWKRLEILSKHLPCKQVSKVDTFDAFQTSHSKYAHDLLIPQANRLSPFISQAISSIAVKKMTLNEIRHWLQENVKNRTKTKDIQTCLESCSIFSKVLCDGVIYWQLAYDRLELKPFGQNILDTGIAGGIEFWQGEHPMMDM